MSNAKQMQLKPGLLVVVNTEIKGGVSYDSKALSDEEAKAADLPEANIKTDNAGVKKVGTVVVTDDPEEFNRAKEIRGAARYKISQLCEETPFGLICEREKAEALAKAIAEAYKLAADFNLGSKWSRVHVRCTRGYQVVDDANDIKRVAEEMADIMKRMDAAIHGCDADAVREEMKRAKAIGQMLDGEHATKVSLACEQARKAANEIAKTLRERGDKAEKFIIKAKSDAVRDARASFLDVIEVCEAQAIPVSSAQAGALDVELDDEQDDKPAGVEDGALVEKVGPEEMAADYLGDPDASKAVDEDAANSDEFSL